ncbi:DUF664 domain-containing protein [Kocuria marina]|uniref:mycothiol transferase n=1 Tax=Kocuria marina TaxID=223184 RepID=UPI001F49F939|nr:DUF664 domain-containing protein [Kocuria sp. KRD140]
MHQLAQIRTTVHGLTDEQAHSVPSASSLNLTGLVRHCALVAAGWSDMAARRINEPDVPEDIGPDLSMEDCMTHPATVDETLAFFDRCVSYASAPMESITDLGAPVPVPDAHWFPPELKFWEVRWALTHVIGEIARHAGHADVIRESIDGTSSYELNDLAEGLDPHREW